MGTSSLVILLSLLALGFLLLPCSSNRWTGQLPAARAGRGTQFELA
jgi:hypothetical protein